MRWFLTICFLIKVLCTSFLHSHAFQSPLPSINIGANNRQRIPSSSSVTQLNAITKRQNFILDGAELSYYMKSLAQQQQQQTTTDDAAAVNELPNLAPRSPEKINRIGLMTFVTVTLEEDLKKRNDSEVWLEKGTHIIGVEASTKALRDDIESLGDSIMSIDDDLHLYRDSIAILPTKKKVSHADAISTAATCLLLGASCNNNSSSDRQKIVIVGGGEYALYLAKAHVGLGNKVDLVSARPDWSLPSISDIASSKEKQNLIEILPPNVGKMSLGFASAIGEFDVLIDTLGDELGMGRSPSILNNMDHVDDSSRFLQQLQELHGCSTYVSTLTRSQQYVLNIGLLFARDPVIRYQKEVEKLTSKKIQTLPPPTNFGTVIQQLFDQNIICKSDSNENGQHGIKSSFVRGWSLSDLTELKTWPMEGAVRFGFPVVDLSSSSLSLRSRNTKSNASIREMKAETTKRAKNIAAVEESIDHAEVEEGAGVDIIMPKSTVDTTIKVTTKLHTKHAPSNPHITSISSASDLNQHIIESKRNCIMFLTAAYCQKCKHMTPQVNRIARISSESSSNVLFAHVDISKGPRGKQLGKILDVNKVPSVVIFQNGERVKSTKDGRDESSSSVVIEKSNLNRLEDVAKMLDKGGKSVNAYTLLSPETVEK